MDLTYTKEYENYREEVREFLGTQWPLRGPEADLPKPEQAKVFMKRATAAGYLNRGVPKRYGGSEQGSDILKGQIIREEFSRKRAPTAPFGNASLVLSAIIQHGTEEQKEHFVPGTLFGDFIWAQGYSEPGSGSDLASIRTKGELVDGEWAINGQKIWTSGAQFCNMMFALLRTEPDAPKHDGISYVLLDMKQPGVEVRPLRQITGGSEFNEIFFTDARAPFEWTIGERGQGWEVSRATLSTERNVVGASTQTEQLLDRLLKLAGSVKRDGGIALKDAEVRQWLAELEGYVLSHQYSSLHQLTRTSKGEDPGRFPLMNKLYGTNHIGLQVARIAKELAGDDALMLATRSIQGGGRGGDEQPQRAMGNERWTNQILGSLGNVVAGGTSNIQRNIIGERGYGLPRDA